MASPVAGLEWVYDLFESHRKTQILITACELEIFDLLENSKRHLSAEEIASEKELNPDSAERFLNACVSLHLLTKNEEGFYSNNEASSKWLLKSHAEAGKPSMWPMARFQKNSLIPSFRRLTESVKSGDRAGSAPLLPYEKCSSKDQSANGELYSTMFKSAQAVQGFVSGMNTFLSPVAEKLAKLFDLSDFKSVLDIGAGSGTMAITMKEVYPSMKVATFELPEVEPELSKRLSGHDVDMYWGNFFSDNLPPADLYIMGHIVHDWQQDRVDVILENAFKHINKGGALLLMENVLPESPQKCGDVFGSYMDLTMLIATGGRERTFTEYKMLLERHGFKNVQWKSAGNESSYDAIMGRKM